MAVRRCVWDCKNQWERSPSLSLPLFSPLENALLCLQPSLPAISSLSPTPSLPHHFCSNHLTLTFDIYVLHLEKKTIINIVFKCVPPTIAGWMRPPPLHPPRRSFGRFPIVIPIKTEKITNMGRKGPRAKTKSVLKSVNQGAKFGTKLNLKFQNFAK